MAAGGFDEEEYDFDEEGDEEGDEDDESFKMTPIKKTSTSSLFLHSHDERKEWGKLKTPQLEKNINSSWVIIKEIFPNLNITESDKISINIDENGEIIVRLSTRINAESHRLFNDDGTLNGKIPNKIKKILGKILPEKKLRKNIILNFKKKLLMEERITEIENKKVDLEDQIDEARSESNKYKLRVQELESEIERKDLSQNEIEDLKKQLKESIETEKIKDSELKKFEKDLKKSVINNLEFVKERNEFMIQNKINEEGLRGRITELELSIDEKELEVKKVADDKNEMAIKLNEVEKENKHIKLTNDRDMREAQNSIQKLRTAKIRDPIAEKNAKINEEILRKKIIDNDIQKAIEIGELRREFQLEEKKIKILQKNLMANNTNKEKEIKILTDRINEYEQINKSDRERVKVLREELKQEDLTVEEKSEKEQEIINIDERIDKRETQIEGTSLKSKIKIIFKKYGLTVIGVLSAITTVIGVIVSNLSSSLSNMAKKLGTGLKDISKKLAQILPGMIGAIASFIFKTAGEVIGFLAENAWLLIVAAVVFFVEEFKKKKQ